jgi:plasmid stabilization system protein ParE
MMKVMISAAAEEDYLSIVRWYKEKRGGLEFEFELCLEVALAAIGRNPESSRLWYKNFRRYIMRRFPYGIHYIIHNDLAIVVAIIHFRRDPAYTRSRLRID